MEIQITLEDYFEELLLMENQYGLEEELYPFINMFLRNGHNVKDISIRTVANGSGTEKEEGRDIISGRISFPDMALLNKEFHKMKGYEYNKDKLLGSVEAKHISKNVLLGIQGKKLTTKLIKRKVIIAKPSKDKPKYYCEAIVEENKDFILKIPTKDNKTVEDMLKKKYGKKKFEWQLINENGCKNGGKFYENISTSEFWEKNEERVYIEIGKELIQLTGWNKINKKYKVDVNDEGQIFGELFWYGKVLYTNGLVWKFLEINECKNFRNNKIYKGKDAILFLRQEIFDNCIANKEKEENKIWYQIFSDKELKITCKKIADFEKGYDFYKSHNKAITENSKKQWNKLFVELAKINWL